MVISSEFTSTKLHPSDFFRVTKFTLSILGVWPRESGEVPFYFYINIFTLFFSSTLGLAYSYVNLDNIVLALDSLCPSTTEFISWVKVLIFLYYRREYSELINTLYEFYINERTTAGIKIYRNAVKYSASISIVLGFFAFLTCTTFAVQPIIINLYRHLNNMPLVREFPTKAVYPFFDEYADPYYFLCYLQITMGAYSTILGFIGMDSMFITLCSHISVRFDVLCSEIENIAETTVLNANSLATERLFTLDENQEIRQKLINVILKHIQMIEITERMVKLYTIIIFAHFLSAAIIICVTSINLLLSHGAGKILYISYITVVMVQLYIYADSGTRIAENSSKIAELCYSFQWPKCNTEIKRMLIMMIQRSQRPINVKVPFFEVSLQAYTKIMSTAGSYIALLNSLLEK